MTDPYEVTPEEMLACLPDPEDLEEDWSDEEYEFVER
jgi:hypothetical protein